MPVLAVLTTHPIQYQVPVWQELARRGGVLSEVWYLSDQGYRNSFDKGFSRAFSWDLDVLTGYSYRFVLTRARRPDINKFWGARINSVGRLFTRPDIAALLINGWHPAAYWQAAFQAHKMRIPVLLRAETNDLRRNPHWKEVIKRSLLKRLFDKISVFLAVGIANRRFYEKYGVPESKLGYAPYCVDNKRFSEAAERFRSERLTVREAWGIPKDGVCFLFSGKLIAKKRVGDLLDALEILLRGQERFNIKRPVHLLVVGDGPLRQVLEKKVRALREIGGKSCVRFAGFLNQTEIPKVYAVADCLVLPSDAGETWGLVVNEAMACGLPAIVSDRVGCGADLIQPGITGDVFPTGDAERLAQVMVAWSDPARCLGAREAVQKKVASYSVERAVDGILEAVGAVSCKTYPPRRPFPSPVAFEDRYG